MPARNQDLNEVSSAWEAFKVFELNYIPLKVPVLESSLLLPPPPNVTVYGDQVKLRLFGWVLIQCDGILVKRGKGRLAYRENDIRRCWEKLPSTNLQRHIQHRSSLTTLRQSHPCAQLGSWASSLLHWERIHFCFGRYLVHSTLIWQP
jgi:hypothetical protein